MLASYPDRLCVFVLQQTNELAKAFFHSLHVVGCAAVKDPAFPSRQRLQLQVLLYLQGYADTCSVERHVTQSKKKSIVENMLYVYVCMHMYSIYTVYIYIGVATANILYKQ